MKLTAESTVFNDDKVQSKFAELVVDRKRGAKKPHVFA